MKKILCLLCGVLSVLMVKAQDLGITYKQELFQFKEDVCKLTVKINYWDRETWTYWYDTNGNVVRYYAQKFKGANQPVSYEMVTLTPEGKMLTSTVTTFENGKQIGVKRDTCKEYNGGATIEIPRPKLETAYYQVPGKKDKRGNWLQVSRSYGNYSEIISREFAYHSSMPNSVKAEFEDIANVNSSVRSYFEHKAQIEAQQKAADERGMAYAGLVGSVVALLLFLWVFVSIRNTLTYRNTEKSKSKSKAMPKINSKDPEAARIEYMYNQWMNYSVTEQIEKDLKKSPRLGGNLTYNKHPKSVYWKVLLAIFMWPWLMAGLAGAGNEETPAFILVIGGIIALFAIVIAGWWLIKGMRYISMNMVLNKNLSNSTITTFMLLMVAATSLFGVYPLLSAYMWPIIAALLTFVAACLYYAFVIAGLLTGRCPNCHAYFETVSLGQESRGLQIERSKESSSTSKGDYTLTKTYEREKTYEKYVTLYRCETCGHRWETKHRRLIGDKSRLIDADLS